MQKKDQRKDGTLRGLAALRANGGTLNGSLNGIKAINGTSDDKGEFDDLISALRTGDVFGDEFSKTRRNRRRGTSPSSNTSVLVDQVHMVNGGTGVRETSRERIISRKLKS